MVDPGGAPSAVRPTVVLGLTWYVLTVTPQCERAVANRLKRQHGGERDADGEMMAPGLATFVPISRRSVRRRGTRYIITQPMLPRYLFAGFADEPRWLDVFGVLGVQSVLGFDGRPHAIAAEAVGDLISRQWTGCFDEGDPPKVQRGMRVVSCRGTVRGSEGDVVEIDKATATASVIFELFGSTPVSIPLDDIVSVAHRWRRMTG